MNEQGFAPFTVAHDVFIQPRPHPSASAEGHVVWAFRRVTACACRSAITHAVVPVDNVNDKTSSSQKR